MGTFIILLVVFIIGKFLFDTLNQNTQIKKQGGMKTKYQKLISILMSESSNAKIFEEKPYSITFGISNMAGTTGFILTQTYGKVNIQWKVDNPVYGNHQLEWVFNEDSCQENMSLRIHEDTANYTQKILSSIDF